MADRKTADTIPLADRKSTRDAWNSARNTELVRRIKAMEEDDLNGVDHMVLECGEGTGRGAKGVYTAA